MNVIDLRVYRDPSFTPVVILIDPQKEYLTRNRALQLPNADAAVANCRRLLDFAREQGFPTAFMRWHQKAKFFCGTQGYCGWIQGLEPHGSDMVFERSMPSCYANKAFAEMMDLGGGGNAIIAGFTGTIACLSTAIDAYHRGHRITFLSDASASHALPSCSDGTSHDLATQIVALYGPVTTTERWIARQEKRRQSMMEGVGD